MMGRRALVAAWLAATLALASPSRGDAVDADIPVAEISAYIQARPAFERNCFRCHSSSGDESSRKAVEALDMSRYPFMGRRGPAAGKMIRKALAGAGAGAPGRRTMPKDEPDSLAADDAALVLKWADIFDASRVKK